MLAVGRPMYPKPKMQILLNFTGTPVSLAFLIHYTNQDFHKVG
jgi:hypothetical protein